MTTFIVSPDLEKYLRAVVLTRALDRENMPAEAAAFLDKYDAGVDDLLPYGAPGRDFVSDLAPIARALHTAGLLTVPDGHEVPAVVSEDDGMYQVQLTVQTQSGTLYLGGYWEDERDLLIPGGVDHDDVAAVVTAAVTTLVTQANAILDLIAAVAAGQLAKRAA